jgi:hypothetical protein
MKTKLLTTVVCGLMLLGLGCSSNMTEKEETEIYNKWKLIGFVDSANGVSITPKPNDNNSYWIAFNDDGTFLARSSTNDLEGEYQVNFSSSTISIRKIGGTKIGEILDGNLFVERLSSIQFFVSEKTSLKLYYNEKDYLLFKHVQQ